MVDAVARSAHVHIQCLGGQRCTAWQCLRGDASSATVDHCIRYYGKPHRVRTDPAGGFRDQGFHRTTASRSIRLATDPAEYVCKVRVFGQVVGTVKQSPEMVA